MSDPCTSYEKWLSKLRDHLAEECYAARTSQRCVVVARHFLDFLAKQHIEFDAATQHTSSTIYNEQSADTADAMVTHPTTEDGGQCRPVASTCSCAWFMGSGHPYRLPSHLRMCCERKSVENMQGG